MDLGLLGTAIAMGIAAIGSALGIGIAGQAAIGSWKKCYMSNKSAPFILTPSSLIYLLAVFNKK